MNEAGASRTQFLLFQTEDGRTHVECRLQGETIWLTQARIAHMYQLAPRNVTLHPKAIYAEGEIEETATCKDYLQVRNEGTINEHSRNILEEDELDPESVIRKFRITATDGKGCEMGRFGVCPSPTVSVMPTLVPMGAKLSRVFHRPRPEAPRSGLEGRAAARQ